MQSKRKLMRTGKRLARGAIMKTQFPFGKSESAAADCHGDLFPIFQRTQSPMQEYKLMGMRALGKHKGRNRRVR
jgi:hypothetical protein